MRKLLFSITAATMLSIPVIAWADEGSDIKVEVNNNRLQFSQPPIEINGTTLVPLRAIFEALGAKVDWDEATQTVKAVKGDTTIQLTIGQTTAYRNNEPVMLSIPSIKINDSTTMVPVRFIAESLGETVNWNNDTATISIDDPSDTLFPIQHTTVNPKDVTTLISAQGEWQSLLDKLPDRINGDHGMFVDYGLPDESTRRVAKDDDIVFHRLYSVDTESQKVEFSSFFDDKQASPVLRFPIQGNSGAIRVRGVAGKDNDNQPATFSIGLENNGVITPIWNVTGGNDFDLTFPCKAGESLIFTVQKTGDSSVVGSYWKNLQFQEVQINQELQISKLEVQANWDPSVGKWTDSGMQVDQNEILLISADGVARHGLTSDYKKWYSTFPDGTRYFLQNRKQDQQPSLTDDHTILPSAPVGALIGIIQQQDGTWTDKFLIGDKTTFRSPANGKLYMGYNDLARAYDDNSGSYNVDLHLFNSNNELPSEQPTSDTNSLRVPNDYIRVLPGKTVSPQVFIVDKDGNQQDISKDKDLTYTSGDPSILQAKGTTLKAGKIERTSLVTVAYKGLSTTLTVEVTSKIPTTMKTSPSQYTLSMGDSSTITVDATYMDHSYDNIARLMDWHSEDPTVASVEGTQITANAPGTTTVIGNYLDISQIKIPVTVNLPIEKLVPTNPTVSLSVGNSKSVSINGIDKNKVVIGDYTDKVEWSVDKPDIVGISEGEITAKARGTATITATYYNLKTTMTVKVN